METSVFSPIARHFANFICRLEEQESIELSLAAALASRQVSAGHICVNLGDFSGQSVDQEKSENLFFPQLDLWREKLINTAVVGCPGDFTPLVLDDKNRLYLHRYWEYEQVVVGFLKTQGAKEKKEVDVQLLKEGIARYFDTGNDNTVDWQAVAAIAAIKRKFCVVTGGPGTGKTFTVAKILALLLEQKGHCRSPGIILAAPTGKAAARLQESIAAAKNTLPCSLEVKNAFPETAMTLHRLLGARPHSPYFRYNVLNPLSADVVIVDEASMIDLPLMAKLFQALSKNTTLILLGDRNQLASVEPGSVFADICTPMLTSGFSRQFAESVEQVAGIQLQSIGDGSPGLCDSIVALKKSYRFKEGSGVGILSTAVNKGDFHKVLEVLGDPLHVDISFHELPAPAKMAQAIAERIGRKKSAYTAAGDVKEAFMEFERFMVICALRHGPYGVEAINQIVESALSGEEGAQQKQFYSGKPVLISRNDYNAGLFNGDIGIILSQEDGQYAFFREGDDTYRKIPVYRLPEYETAHAMTVHKSQGSEFESILLILPDCISPVLTRELVYTAITRAKHTVEIWADRKVFAEAVNNTVSRESGVCDALMP
jgi:exodeoxyribonuclease V alpha subunit